MYIDREHAVFLFKYEVGTILRFEYTPIGDMTQTWQLKSYFKLSLPLYNFFFFQHEFIQNIMCRLYTHKYVW